MGQITAPLNCQVQHPQHRRCQLLLINTTEETEKPLRNMRVHTAVQWFPYQKHSLFSAGPLNPPWDQPSKMNSFCGRCQHRKAVPQKRSSVILTAAQSLCANTVGYRHIKRLRAQSRRHFVMPFQREALYLTQHCPSEQQHPGVHWHR